MEEKQTGRLQIPLHGHDGVGLRFDRRKAVDSLDGVEEGVFRSKVIGRPGIKFLAGW